MSYTPSLQSLQHLREKLISLQVPKHEASDIVQFIDENLKTYSEELTWQKVLKKYLANTYPSPYSFPVHLLLYQTIYPNWQSMPRPYWFPDVKMIQESNIAKFMNQYQFKEFRDFHHFSVKEYPIFWKKMVELLGIQFDTPYESVVDLGLGVEKPLWFSGSTLNIINSCFKNKNNDNKNKQNKIAIIARNESSITQKITYEELDKLSNCVANSLSNFIKKGDSVAIIMPMTIEAVAIYLGIIKMGGMVVSIADSFAKEEIATRLTMSNAKLVFTAEHIVRDGKRLPLYEKVAQATESIMIVLPAENLLELGNEFYLKKRNQDIFWKDFLKKNEKFSTISCHPDDAINILFSSGTTGFPKAIPWTHTTPIKVATDAYFHHDVKENDIFCWPSSLGWMMGPWLIFACLINNATIALYEGVPSRRSFGEFIQDEKITCLGVVPTLVKQWRLSGCMEGLDWQSIKLFTSTGECSNVEDMLYLAKLANYPPIIEYCGGTEIGGGYITSTVVEPIAPAAFSTPALGLDFIIIDQGEVALLSPSIGLSTELLNADHHKTYYEGMPTMNSKKTKFEERILRRHGDQLDQAENGFFRVLGRLDDTMNLGGIKVSSGEIEKVLNNLPEVFETAAVETQSADSGPSVLTIVVVLKDKSKNTDEQMARLKLDMQQAIKEHLNPLFKIEQLIVIDQLPRTASNKVLRRMLRETESQQLKDIKN